MHPADIQAALKKRGVTQKEIADQIGVSGMMVSQVIHRRSVSDRVMRAVAEGIGKDPAQVFAWYYLKSKRARRNSRSAAA